MIYNLKIELNKLPSVKITANTAIIIPRNCAGPLSSINDSTRFSIFFLYKLFQQLYFCFFK